MKTIKSFKIFKDKAYCYLLISSIIFIISIFLSLLLLKVIKPKIIFLLNGDKNTIVEVYNEYIDEGITLEKNGKKKSLSVEGVSYAVSSDYNKDKIGKYKYVYNIKYKNKEYQLIRTLLVKDKEKPELKVDVDKVVVYSCTDLEHIKIKYSALDNYDGDITDKIERKNNKNEVIISVEDSSDNKAEITIPVEYKDETNPVIEIDQENVSIVLGGTYTEKGAKAYNACGVDISNKITISGDVDTNNLGTYNITYAVTTDSGLSSSKVRMVTVAEEKKVDKGNKVIYLTFDDGPGKYTSRLLDILNKYNVKATFFVTAQFNSYVSLIEREAAEGHAVAVHTKTHQWSIYESLETYLDDFNQMNDIIEKYTGNRSKIFRFPGGSSNTVSCGANAHTLPAVVDYMNQQGYVYFDWNVDSRDAEGKSSEQIKNNIINGVRNRSNSVVLCHDIKPNTVDVMEEFIKYALANGYTFKTLDENGPVVHHGINKCHYK